VSGTVWELKKIFEKTGNSENMENIFFGSSTERVLRLIKHPVLCVSENEEHKPD
jgi:nucleotide-binding universal stress UspA family protein